MKNNFFTHKFLPIIGVFLLVAFSLCTSCFASSVSYNDELVELPSFFDDYYYFIYFKCTYDSSIEQYGYSYIYCFSHNPIFVSDVNGRKQLTGENCSYNCSGNSGSNWTSSSTPFQSFINSIPEPTRFSGGVWINSVDYDNGIILCNHDIKDVNGNVVFQVAPQVEEVPKVELMKATQVEEIPQQIVAVVMIVLPIFLAIFGVLLVLYLIKSKNLLQL